MCTHCVCVFAGVCVCVCECAMRVCGTLPGRTVSPGKGAEEEVVGLASPSTQFVEQLLHL